MLRGGLRPLLGIMVVIAHERRSDCPIPVQLRDEWRLREPADPTHQEHEVFDSEGAVDPEDELEVYPVNPVPGVYDDEVVYIWGSETCPPLAYDGIKAHGSVCVTAYNIPPSQYGRVTEPCDSNRRRLQWANERFAFTVRSMSFLNPFTPYAVHRLSRSQTCSSGVMPLRRAPTGCAWTTRWSCSSAYVAMSLGMTHRTSLPFRGFLALWHAQHQPGI